MQVHKGSKVILLCQVDNIAVSATNDADEKVVIKKIGSYMIHVIYYVGVTSYFNGFYVNQESNIQKEQNNDINNGYNKIFQQTNLYQYQHPLNTVICWIVKLRMKMKV